MAGRYIIDNFRLVIDILDYPELFLDGSFILFWDFQKAFDSIEHNFISKALEKNLNSLSVLLMLMVIAL